VTSADADKIAALERLLHAPLERLTLQGFDYARPAPEGEPRLLRQPRRYGTGSRRPVRHSQQRGLCNDKQQRQGQGTRESPSPESFPVHGEKTGPASARGNRKTVVRLPGRDLTTLAMGV
jgi:hypothetical protein